MNNPAAGLGDFPSIVQKLQVRFSSPCSWDITDLICTEQRKVSLKGQLPYWRHLPIVMIMMNRWLLR